jgi:hypothetical protein
LGRTPALELDFNVVHGPRRSLLLIIFIMSFGWSVGDIIDGLKVVWDVWQAVSDGPLNAEYQALQFFDEFHLIFTRLDGKIGKLRVPETTS